MLALHLRGAGAGGTCVGKAPAFGMFMNYIADESSMTAGGRCLIEDEFKRNERAARWAVATIEFAEVLPCSSIFGW